MDCSPSLSVSRARFLPFGAAFALVALVTLLLRSSGSGVVAGVSLTELSALNTGEFTDEGLVEAAELRVVCLVLTMTGDKEKNETQGRASPAGTRRAHRGNK